MGCSNSVQPAPPPIPPVPLVDGHNVEIDSGLHYREATHVTKMELGSKLMAAVKRGDVADMQQLLVAMDTGQRDEEGEGGGGAVNYKGMWGSTPLIIATQYGQVDAALALLAYQNNTKNSNNNNKDQVQDNDEDKDKNKVDIDMEHINERGASALLHASMEGQTTVVQTMLSMYPCLSLSSSLSSTECVNPTSRSLTLSSSLSQSLLASSSFTYGAEAHNHEWDITGIWVPLSAVCANGYSSIMQLFLNETLMLKTRITIENDGDSGNASSNASSSSSRFEYDFTAPIVHFQINATAATTATGATDISTFAVTGSGCKVPYAGTKKFIYIRALTPLMIACAYGQGNIVLQLIEYCRNCDNDYRSCISNSTNNTNTTTTTTTSMRKGHMQKKMIPAEETQTQSKDQGKGKGQSEVSNSNSNTNTTISLFESRDENGGSHIHHLSRGIGLGKDIGVSTTCVEEYGDGDGDNWTRAGTNRGQAFYAEAEAEREKDGSGKDQTNILQILFPVEFTKALVATTAKTTGTGNSKDKDNDKDKNSKEKVAVGEELHLQSLEDNMDLFPLLDTGITNINIFASANIANIKQCALLCVDRYGCIALHYCCHAGKEKENIFMLRVLLFAATAAAEGVRGARGTNSSTSSSASSWVNLASAETDSDTTTTITSNDTKIDPGETPSSYPKPLLPYPTGTTALHIAIQKKSIELVRLLINAGANPFIANSRGITSMDMAKKIPTVREDIEVVADAVTAGQGQKQTESILSILHTAEKNKLWDSGTGSWFTFSTKKSCFVYSKEKEIKEAAKAAGIAAIEAERLAAIEKARYITPHKSESKNKAPPKAVTEIERERKLQRARDAIQFAFNLDDREMENMDASPHASPRKPETVERFSYA